MAAVDTGGTTLTTEDIIVVVAYFVLVIGIGIFASCRASRGTVSGYFLAGRSMNFIAIGASLFVSNIGSEHFIGLAGSGAATGINVGAWEFNAILLLQLLGWVFIPVYIACQTYTMPEYLSKRFGGQRMRVYFACLSLVLYIFTKCSVDLFTGGLFIQQSLGWDLYLCIFVLLAIVGLLTVTGGLTAVIYTDTLQAFLMVAGAVVLMVLGFIDLGGFDGMWAKYPYAFTNYTLGNDTDCHMPSEKWNIMLRGPADNDMPWIGFLLGQTPGSIWYWCTDQVIVQRALAAKSLSHAQAATLMAGLIKVLPLFIMVMPGMMARIKYPDVVGCVDPAICDAFCQSRSGCTNVAYPKIVLGLMPTGLRGMMMAVMIAALMSDLDSIFNSASTLFTIDIYKRIRKNCKVKEQMVVGRLFVVVMVAVAVAWVPVVKETQGGQVFIYIQEITNYLAPPVACVFLIALLWKRCNEQGAFWGLMAGFVAGLVRLVLIFVYRPPEHCGLEDERPAILKDVHYMYFAMMLFWLTFIVTVVVSLLTKPPSEQHLFRTTFWTRNDTPPEELVMERYKHIPDKGYTNQAASVEEGGTGVEGAADTNTGAHQVSVSVISVKNDGTENLPIDKPATSESLEKRTWKEYLENWFCGISKSNEEEDQKARQRENMISTLEQDSRARIALTVGLLILLGIGVVLYCFWSLWGYWVTLPADQVEPWKLDMVQKWRPMFLNRTSN